MLYRCPTLRIPENLAHIFPRISNVRKNEEHVIVYAAEKTIKAKRAVIALPPIMAGRIDYEPSLPQMRNQLTDRVPAGQIIRCYAIYDTPFWRNDGFSGTGLDVDEAPQACIDTSPPNQSKGVLTAYVWGPLARHYATVSAEERKKAFLKGLTKRFGGKAAHPQYFAELDWSNEKWSRGAVFGHYGPGVLTGFGPAMRQPCGRLHWAGTETAVQWSGNIEGAILSGERAAEEVTKLVRVI